MGLDGVFQAKPPRKGHVLGSVLTDGIQAIFRWDKPTTETWRLAPEKRDEIVAARVEKAALRQQYEAQESRATGLQAELAALKAEKGPKEAIRQKKAEIKENRKIDGRTVRTKTRFADMRICPKTEGLEHAKTGYFAQDALGTVERTELPTNLIAVDAGHANVWSASRYNPTKKDWERVAELTSGQYRHGIGLRRFQRWMETSLRRPKMQMAREKLSRSTLKVSDAETYVVNLKTRAEAWTTLHGFYGGKRYARRRFAQQKTKQRFEATFLDSFMEKCEQKKGDTVIAYGDGLFATSLPGCDGGTPHARLCRKLAGRCVVVMTDEYLTTKRCPHCRIDTHIPHKTPYACELYCSAKMVQPKGVVRKTDRNGVERRKRVHGLSHCAVCHKQWSRDYAATINIGQAFLAAWWGQERPRYLSRQTQCAEATGSLRIRMGGHMLPPPPVTVG